MVTGIARSSASTSSLYPGTISVSTQPYSSLVRSGWPSTLTPCPAGTRLIQASTPGTHRGQAEWMHALCSAWPHDPGVSGTVRSTVPVVFLNGTADNTDPPANVAAAPATMPSALLVSVPGTGHWTLANATEPGCLLAAATAFIQVGQPANPAPWNACTRALAQQLVPFPAP